MRKKASLGGGETPKTGTSAGERALMDQLEILARQAANYRDLVKVTIPAIVGAERTLSDIQRAVFTAGRVLAPGCYIGLVLHKEETGELVIHPDGLTSRSVCQVIPWGCGVTGRAALMLQTIYEPDVLKAGTDRFVERADLPTRSNLGIPLIRTDKQGKKKLLGILDVESAYVDGIRPEVRELLEAFAQIVALVMDWAGQYEQAEEIQTQKANLEKVALFQAVASNLAHRVPNEIGIIPPAVEQIKALLSTGVDQREQVLRYLGNIHEAAHRLLKMVQMLKKPFSSQQPVVGDVLPLLQEALDRVITEEVQREKRVRLLTPDMGVKEAVINIDRDGLFEVFRIVLQNAVDAMTGGGEVEVSAAIVPGPNSRLKLSVFDNGPGLTPEVEKRVFDLFYSTKPERGLGYGLWYCKLFVESYGGQIDLTNRPKPKRGAVATLMLPCRDIS